MQRQIYSVDISESGERIDTFLSKILENYSRTKIQQFIKEGTVLVNGNKCKPSLSLQTDDEILCDLKDTEELKIEPENIPLDIIWEDENYSIVNKPSGMLTHPTSKEKNGTLVNALLYKYGTTNLSDVNGNFRRGILHRLDRNTSGLLIIAKNNDAHIKMAQMIKNRQVEKRYRAVVKGVISENIIINQPIGRSKRNPTKMEVSPDGKPSLTEVYIIKQFSDATYVDINLKTGRTHQIRVHLSSIGHPVYNDTLYGFGKMKVITDEQVLQSYKLKFKHPFSNEIIEIEIEPDKKIQKVLKYLENK